MTMVGARKAAVCSWPFRHTVIDEALDPPSYERVATAFRAKEQGAGARATAYENYDAKMIALGPADQEAFAPLLDRSFLETISRLMDKPTRMEVDVGLHIHPAGSRPGWIHNDFNPAWFEDLESGDAVRFSNRRVNYRTGAAAAGVAAAERMRGLTLIYFLNNDTWTERDGGGTGLFLAQTSPLADPIRVVPPRNNTLLIFECSPHSWHSFLGTAAPRRSISLWLHRDKAEVLQQWPYHAPVRWS